MYKAKKSIKPSKIITKNNLYLSYLKLLKIYFVYFSVNNKFDFICFVCSVKFIRKSVSCFKVSVIFIDFSFVYFEILKILLNIISSESWFSNEEVSSAFYAVPYSLDFWNCYKFLNTLTISFLLVFCKF